MTTPALPIWLESTYASLIKRFRENTLGHAPLLYGPQGAGKYALADTLARSVLCGHYSDDGLPCGECVSCRLLAVGNHPDRFDIKPLEAGKAITVDQVRGLIEQLALTPAMGQYRLGVITPAESMNINASNALLKSLEEPPDNVLLILVSHREQALLPTILSRCQKVPISVPSQATSLEWLEVHSSSADSSLHQLALRMSSGAPLLADHYIETGQVEEAREILSELLNIAGGGGVSPDLAERWAAQADSVWSWLAFWVSEIARSAASGESTAELAPLLSSSSDIDWSELWKGALEGRGLSGSGIRHDLLLGRWLLVWESVVYR